MKSRKKIQSTNVEQIKSKEKISKYDNKIRVYSQNIAMFEGPYQLEKSKYNEFLKTFLDKIQNLDHDFICLQEVNIDKFSIAKFENKFVIKIQKTDTNQGVTFTQTSHCGNILTLISKKYLFKNNLYVNNLLILGPTVSVELIRQQKIILSEHKNHIYKSQHIPENILYDISSYYEEFQNNLKEKELEKIIITNVHLAPSSNLSHQRIEQIKNMQKELQYSNKMQNQENESTYNIIVGDFNLRNNEIKPVIESLGNNFSDCCLKIHNKNNNHQTQNSKENDFYPNQFKQSCCFDRCLVSNNIHPVEFNIDKNPFVTLKFDENNYFSLQQSDHFALDILIEY